MFKYIYDEVDYTTCVVVQALIAILFASSLMFFISMTPQYNDQTSLHGKRKQVCIQTMNKDCDR